MESVFLDEWGAFLRFYDLPGRSPTRVYLHGLAISSSSASFAKVVMQSDLIGHRSLLVDFLGFGFSDRPKEFSYTHEDQARAIAGLLANSMWVIAYGSIPFITLLFPRGNLLSPRWRW